MFQCLERSTQFSLRNGDIGNGSFGFPIVQERSHPAVPHIKESSIVVVHVGMVVVVMGDVIESLEQPVLRDPVWYYLVTGVSCDIDDRVVGKISQQHDRFEWQKNHNQAEASELQDCL